MTRIVIADDEALVREGLVAIVGSNAAYDVVGTATDGVEAVAAVHATEPDVVLMDIRMPVLDGIEATRQIVASRSAARVLILTTIETDEVVAGALRAGASGFLLKSVTREHLWWGIDAVAAGNALLAPSITRRLIEQHVIQTGSTRPSMQLTERQGDVVRLLSQGLSNLEIAQRLHLAETTVKGYVSEVLVRHHLRDRTQLVVHAYETGLIKPGDAAGPSRTGLG